MPTTIGILGGGQLGRMLALAGIPLGLRFRFLEKTRDCPAAEVGEVVVGEYDDPAALQRFAAGLTVATYEFENVPAATARWLTDHVPVFPPEGVLATAQERLAEKRLFRSLGIGTPEFASVRNPEDLRAAAAALGFPCILKTCRLGYDGKGQWLLRGESDLAAAPSTGELVLEQHVAFVRELSIIAARSRSGEMAFYPLSQNVHAGGILRESIAPAPGATPATQTRAESIARRVLDATGYVGVLAIELFELPGGELLANEMAPRVHNSGHWSQDGAACSQFENHLRAIMGWPLGQTSGRPTAMLNILRAIPEPSQLLDIPGLHLHLYGKQPARGLDLRKVGHINIVADDEAGLMDRVALAKSRLTGSV